ISTKTIYQFKPLSSISTKIVKRLEANGLVSSPGIRTMAHTWRPVRNRTSRLIHIHSHLPQLGPCLIDLSLQLDLFLLLLLERQHAVRQSGEEVEAESENGVEWNLFAREG